MKKILIISFYAYSLFNKEKQTTQGGSEMIAYQIAKNLNKEKFDVHFITANNPEIKEGLDDGINLHKGPSIENSTPIQGVRNFLKLFMLIREINPDVIFSSSAGWLTVELIIIKILLRKKYVFRSSHKRNIDGYTDQRSYGWLYRKLLNQIDCFVLRNYEDIPILKKNYNFKQRTVIIRNFQDIPQETPPPRKERNALLWVGRSEKIKNPQLFLSVAKALPDYKFVMIMPKTNQTVFSNIVTEAKNINNLEIIDGVERTAIMKYYKKALYFISTSQGEGFPNVLVESMKYGTPIISFFLDYDNIIKENKCGFIESDIAKISDIIRHMDEVKWSILSNNCYTFSKNNLNVKTGIEKYEQLFLQL